VFIYPNDDQGTAVAILPFNITIEEIQQGVFEWPAHLQPFPAKDIDTLKMHTKRNQDRKKAEATWK
jgi:hypothetical protein